MIDSMLAELENRMKTYDDISNTFGFLSELTSLNIEQIEDKAKNLVSLYPDDLEDTLLAELIQFAAFMHTQKPATERISRDYHVQAFVIVESFSDISKRRDCVAHLSVYDGVQCLRRAELLKVGNSQRRAAILNRAGMLALIKQ